MSLTSGTVIHAPTCPGGVLQRQVCESMCAFANKAGRGELRATASAGSCCCCQQQYLGWGHPQPHLDCSSSQNAIISVMRRPPGHGSTPRPGTTPATDRAGRHSMVLLSMVLLLQHPWDSTKRLQRVEQRELHHHPQRPCRAAASTVSMPTEQDNTIIAAANIYTQHTHTVQITAVK